MNRRERCGEILLLLSLTVKLGVAQNQSASPTIVIAVQPTSTSVGDMMEISTSFNMLLPMPTFTTETVAMVTSSELPLIPTPTALTTIIQMVTTSMDPPPMSSPPTGMISPSISVPISVPQTPSSTPIGTVEVSMPGATVWITQTQVVSIRLTLKGFYR